MCGCWGVVWLLGGMHGCRGACVVARGGMHGSQGGMCGCQGHAWFTGGMHGCQWWGACVVAGGVHGCWGCVWLLRGHVWLPGGMCGCQGHVWLPWGMCGCQGCVWLLVGMHGCQGVCMAKGGMCGKGAMHGEGGHACWRGVCGERGACMVKGGMHGIRWDMEIRSMSGWYASYWNAFLLLFTFIYVILTCVKNKLFDLFHNDNSCTKLYFHRTKTKNFVCKCLVQCDLLRVTDAFSCKRAWQQKSV